MAKELKVLYLSSHSILEHDELKLFGEIGWSYLSLGAYYCPYGDESTDSMRPQLPAKYNLFDELKGDYDRNNLTEEQISKFDVIIIMHHPEEESSQPWLVKNWERFKSLGKPVVFRSIGQSSRLVERIIKPLKEEGLLVVRYSPKEKEIPHYCGEDAMIRFYKDQNEFCNWNGEDKKVITIGQSMKQRGSSCNYDAFVKATDPFERRLFGPGNEGSGIKGGLLSFDGLKQELRDSRVYFCTNTQPASYTLNFLEAWMMGIPVVALGPEHCNKDYPEQKTYEIHELITNGVDGFWSDDINELQKYVKMLLDDHSLAKKIGDAGRKTAIDLFGKDNVKNDWKLFLEKITNEK